MRSLGRSHFRMTRVDGVGWHQITLSLPFLLEAFSDGLSVWGPMGQSFNSHWVDTSAVLQQAVGGLLLRSRCESGPGGAQRTASGLGRERGAKQRGQGGGAREKHFKRGVSIFPQF